MSKLTYLELCQKTRQECSIPGSGPASVTDQNGILQRIVTWVADADYMIQSAYADWNFLWAQWAETTIVSTANYVAPSDLGSWDTESFYLDYTTSHSTPLKLVGYPDWRAKYRNGSQTASKPNQVTILPDRSVTLSPTPDGAYALTADYHTLPTRLTANTDTSAIPERFERAIIALAKTKFAEEEGSPVLLQNAMNEYVYWLEELKKHELPDQFGRAHARAGEMVVRPE